MKVWARAKNKHGTVTKYGNLLESLIHARKTAVRFIACNIEEDAFLITDGTYLRRFDLYDSIAAITAFPGVFGSFCFDISHI